MNNILATVVLLLLSVAFAQDFTAQSTGELTDFIEFSRIVPDMNSLLGMLLTLMEALNLPGTIDMIARFLSGGILVMALVIGYLNYGTGKEINIIGINGSFNNILLSVFAVVLVATGVPRLVGEATWALWRVTYVSVNTVAEPMMTEVIQENAGALAEAVYRFGVSGGAIGASSFFSAENLLAPPTTAPGDPVAGGGAQAADSTNQEAERMINDTRRYGTLWSLASLLIIFMFMAYIGVLWGSGVFVLLISMFMPAILAFLGVNSRLFADSLGRIVASILVVATAPVLMMLNVMIVFQGPIAYLTDMMATNADQAAGNAQMRADGVAACIAAMSPTGGGLAEVVGNAIAPVYDLSCRVTNGILAMMTGMTQMIFFIAVGLIVAAVIFVGLCGLAAITFREFNNVVSHVFGKAAGDWHNSKGGGRALAASVTNRAGGMAVAGAGLLTKNNQLARAGIQSVTTGRSAGAALVGGMMGARAEKNEEKRRDTKAAAAAGARDARQGRAQKLREVESELKSVRGGQDAEISRQYGEMGREIGEAKREEQRAEREAKRGGGGGGGKNRTRSDGEEHEPPEDRR